MKTCYRVFTRIKVVILLIPMLLVLTLGCNQTEQKPIEGSWQLIYGKYISEDTVTYELPGNLFGDQIKMWSENHYIFTGQFKLDTVTMDNYGWGTYSLEMGRYDENMQFRNGNSMEQTIKMQLEINNDTLIQTWPLDENGELDPANVNVEKYVRLD